MVPDNPQVIDGVLGNLRQAFRSSKTRPLEFRRTQLQNLVRGMQEMEAKIVEAVMKDLGYGNKDTASLFCLTPVIGEVEYILRSFESWAAKKTVETSLVVGPGDSYIIPEPYGVTLVIGAWNYPFATTVGPAALAIAAGNCVALKPSEMSPHNSNVIAALFNQYLDKDCYAVIEGQVEVAKVICTKPWDHIIFTGSPLKGKLVAKAAAENLIPLTLELGGKSPTIVDIDVKMDVAVSRIISGKLQNAGQTCIAPDYVLVHERVKDAFLAACKAKISHFTLNNPKASGDFSRMINEFHTRRMQSMLSSHGGELICGGDVHLSAKYVDPTIILNPRLDSECMVDEIFGPILPVITFKHIDEAINFINDRPKPLALYYFGHNSANKKRLLKETSSGVLSFNECVMHFINHTLPFGGVGNSGYGALHGKIGFENCSHLKPVLDKSGILGSANSYPLTCRYPPFDNKKMKTLKFLLDKLDCYPSEILKSKTFIALAVIIPTAITLSLLPYQWY